MEPNYSKIFNNKLLDTITSYCKLNKVEDVDGFIKKCFDSGFNIERYGLLEKTLNDGEKHLKTSEIQEKRVEIEVIREKRVEVPVEVIKEIIVEKEIIKEVPVEKVITKIEYVSNKDSENELLGKIEQLEDKMSKKDKELDELRHNLDIKLDKTNEKMLQETLQKLRRELTTKDEKIKELEKINQELQVTRNPLKGFFMRGSNLNDTV
jgi:predicted RNase H-like nuclease (RuvC/YqgF family)